MMTKGLLAACLLALVSLPVRAQSLAEASEKAKAERAKGHGWPASTSLGTPTEITDKDLPATVPTTPAEEQTPAFKAAMKELASVPAPKAGPTAAQLHELDLTAARVTLRSLKQSLKDGEDTQRKTQQMYDNTCGNPSTLDLMRSCARINASLQVTIPSTLRRLRASISDLEAKLAVAR